MRPPTYDEVLDAVLTNEARTISEIASAACGPEAWRFRTTVRNRVYRLWQQGKIICDDNRPMHFLKVE